jgi:ATP-dependent DNA ligase
MLAKDSGMKPPRVEVDPRRWRMEPKLDGIRMLYERTEDGFVEYSGRHGRATTGQGPLIERALMYLPVGTIVDTELVREGRPAAEVISAMVNDLPLQAWVFDVLALGGRSVCGQAYEDRRVILEKIGTGFDEECLQLVPSVVPSQALYEKWVGNGLEGAILKELGSTYRQGSRPKAWTKLKPEADQLVLGVVLGWQYGRGKSNGHLASSFDVELLDTGAVTSVGYGPLTPAEADAKIGCHMDVKHYGRTRHGKARHPGCAAWRPEMD